MKPATDPTSTKGLISRANISQVGGKTVSPLTKTPKEILSMETVKFKAPPPMAGPAENQNKNKFCEFHRDKGHNTDEYIHLRRQIKEAVKSGQLSHLVKQIKQRGRKGEQAKAAKKGEATIKEKATTIFMVMADKKTNCDRRGSRGTSHPPHVYGWGIGLRSDISITIQWYNRPPRAMKNLSGPIYNSRDAQIPSGGRNIDNSQQYHNTSRVQNGSRSTKQTFTLRINDRGRNQSSNPPRTPIRDTTKYKWQRKMRKKQLSTLAKDVFCYTKILFGLKNAGATYQRLVDKAFEKQIGRNLEVYVDVLVIKSHTKHEILKDIKETFHNLRKINMKHNPKKCTFGAEEGAFLGHAVSMQGIKAYPKKAEAVMKLQSPRTLKEA
ncbi:reverse transcriptase domain-containing protein [Tanacetum coccineum]